jgi:CRP-like cAMP-binding protein
MQRVYLFSLFAGFAHSTASAGEPSTIVRVMSRPRPSDRLAEHPVFAECSRAELQEIDRLSDEVHIPAGRELMRQGELGREFVVILTGEAAVERDGVEVARIGPGAFVGELALLANVRRNATVTALTDMEIEVIDRRAFQTLLRDSPTLCRSLLNGVATRLAALESSDIN